MTAACLLHFLSTYCFTLFLIMAFSFSPPFALPLFFNITTFDGRTNNIAYQGDGSPANGSIELTLIAMFRVGRAIYTEPLRLWDASTGLLTDFTTRFSFTIDTLNTTMYSDGFAFFLAPVGYPIPPNGCGGYFGLFNTTTGNGVPQNHVFLVEFDTFLNDYDPPIQHVGINRNSIISLAYNFFDIDNNIGKPVHALITYNASTRTLDIFWSFNATNTGSLSYRIDLMELLPEWVTIGFSGATGMYSERHIIHTWEFSSTLNSTDSKDATNKGPNRRVVAGVASASSFIFVLVVVVTVIWFFINKKKARKRFDSLGDAPVEFDFAKAAIPRRFHYQELVAATNGFANDRRLGRGGSGQVYKGILGEVGRIVAIKRIFADFENTERIFINEVRIISRLIHRNLVQFIGWCHEDGEFLLIFEYMPNGSLDTHLFGNNKRTLPWDVRYKIAQGVATALHYLHEEAEQSVLHRDIKCANVLLDTDFSTKLGDFGVAKLVDPRLRTQRMTTTGVVGTYGYLAPEYMNGGRASKESDIYSLGVVALEIACGRRTYQDGEYHVSLVSWVWQHYVEGNILNVSDERLEKEFDVNEMRSLLIVGLWCTHPKDKERPTAAQVLKALRLEATLPVLPHDMHDFAPLDLAYSYQSTPISTSLGNLGR